MIFSVYLWYLKILVFWNHNSFIEFSCGQFYLNPFYQNDILKFCLMMSLPTLLLLDLFHRFHHWGTTGHHMLPVLFCLPPPFHGHKSPLTRTIETDVFLLLPTSVSSFTVARISCETKKEPVTSGNFGCPHPPLGSKVKLRFLSSSMGTLWVRH